MKPRLRVLSLGAGVQSTTVALMGVHKEIPHMDHAIFSDTGWEPQSVYDHLQWLKPILEENGTQVHIVSAGNLRKDALGENPDITRVASMPIFVKNPDGTKGLLRRQCTLEYKINPLMKKQRELVGLKPRQRWKEEQHHCMDLVMGISWDETQRMKDPNVPWVANHYPLIDNRMTRYDCLKWMEDKGYPRPPRSACLGCPYHNDVEWRHIKTTDPDGWADAVDFDEKLRKQALVVGKLEGEPYLHRSMLPLSEVDLRNEEDMGQINLFDQECEGMCGI